MSPRIGEADDAAVSDEACQALLRELAGEREEAPAHLFEWPRLHRFILGSDHSVSEAAAQFRKMLKWRKEADMERRREQIVGKPWHPDSAPGMAKLFQMLAISAETHLEDGSLLWLQFDGQMRLDELQTMSDEELFDAAYLMFELREEYLDRISLQSGRLIREVQVRNMCGLSISRFLQDRSAMARLKAVMSVAPMAYPEPISKVMIVNVPPAFSLLWAILSPMFPPRLRRQISIFGGEFLEEYAQLVGTRGLEATARAWCRGKCEGKVEVKAGQKEYLCYRLGADELGEWCFNASPMDGSGGLEFSISFIRDEDSGVHMVQAPTYPEDVVRGCYRAKVPGLLWFTWANPGGWTARVSTRSAVDLRLGSRVMIVNAPPSVALPMLLSSRPSRSHRLHARKEDLPREEVCRARDSACCGISLFAKSSGPRISLDVRPRNESVTKSVNALPRTAHTCAHGPMVSIDCDGGEKCKGYKGEAPDKARALSRAFLISFAALVFLLLLVLYNRLQLCRAAKDTRVQ